MNKKISVIVPFYNEQWNVVLLFEEIVNSLKKDFSGFDYEIIMVNDWSKDDTWKDILKCKKIDKNVIWINLNRNYGQSIALNAWFKQCKWDFVFSIDWDRQNDPTDFKRLYEELIKWDFDVVAWRRQKRKDPNWMLVITKVARFLRWVLIKDWVNDSWCTLRIYKKVVVENLYLWWEMHRYIIAISKINWFKIGQIPVNHRAREVGTSKYNWSKSIKWLIDLFYVWFIAKYQWRPLHLFWLTWFLNFGIWMILFLYSLYAKVFQDKDLSDNGYFILSIFLIQIWVIFFLFWIIIDILIRNYYNNSREQRYIIKEII